MFRAIFKPKPPVPGGGGIASLYVAAASAHHSGDFTGAVALCDQIIALEPNQAEAHYKRGNALKDLGNFAAALAAFDEAVNRKPDFAHAWCNRGVVLQSLAQHELALASYDRAIAHDPTDAIAYVNRGALHQAMASWDRALASYEEAIARNPRLVHVWFHRGNVHRELGQLKPALACYDEAIKLKPDYAEAYYNRGVLLERSGNPNAALAGYDHAVALYPQFHQAHYNRAAVLKALGQKEAALTAYGRAIAANTDYAEAYLNRGVLLQELGRREAALADYDRAISLRPDHAEAHFNRGTLLSVSLQSEAAMASFDRSIALNPRCAAAYCERARVLLQLRRLDDAISSYSHAIALEPDFAEAQYNKSLALLLAGDYENGWLLYEWRWRNADRLSLGETRTFRQPLWLGQESIMGKTLLVYCEQGYGDTLQFCRFTKAVQDLGGKVILEVQQPLASLLAGLDGVWRVIAQGSPLPEFDFQCPLMSLPLALKRTINSIPSPMRYLRCDESKMNLWRERLGHLGRPRIGLTWSGNPRQGDDQSRSIKLAHWIEHLPRGFRYISLQKEIRAADLKVLEATPWIERFDSELHDFSDTAALCESVDLVISVCTSIAHLSGALGRPTWVLLACVPDWRWLLDRDDSPWYPTARLYRQQSIGDWDGVLERIGADLRREIAGGS